MEETILFNISMKKEIYRFPITNFAGVLSKFKKRIFIDFGNHKDTVFIAGTGRSGTTWLENIINTNESYRILFEPFHAKKVSIIKHWNYRQYIREDDRKKKFLTPASKILTGKIRHPWIDGYNEKIFFTKRLIKDIRANLFLKWIKKQFPETSIILLLRHPCAVANSKLKLNWETHLEEFLNQSELMVDFLNPFKKEIESATDTFEKHIFLWCIENFIPLKQFGKGEIHIQFYENLCTSPKTEIEAISEFLNESLLPKALEVWSEPSQQIRDHSAILNDSDPVNSWKKSISEDQINRAVGIMKIFDLDNVYGKASMPKVDSKSILNIF